MITLIGSLNLIFKELAELRSAQTWHSIEALVCCQELRFSSQRQGRLKKTNPLINSETPADAVSTGVSYGGAWR